LLDLLASHGAAASLTCVEMRDCEHPPHAHCRPQALLDQVVAAASVAGSSGSASSSSSNNTGVPLAGENALQRYDDAAASALVERASSLSQLTFLRMGDLMFDNWGAFAALLARLRVRE
jgi:beta-amylase